MGGENQKYGIPQVQIFSFFDFPDSHLTFTRPGPGPELDNFVIPSLVRQQWSEELLANISGRDLACEVLV